MNRKAKELSTLAQELQKQREIRENEAHQPPVNSNYQEEINIRLRELAELSKCGTLDIVLKVATDTM